MIEVTETRDKDYYRCLSCNLSSEEKPIFRVRIGITMQSTSSVNLCNDCIKLIKEFEVNNG